MSNPSTQSAEPSDRKVLYSAFAWVGVLFLFALIVVIAYLPNSKGETSTTQADEIRLKIKEETYARQQRLMTSYEWVNEAEGIVRIPVERAKGLVLAEIQAEQAGNSGS